MEFRTVAHAGQRFVISQVGSGADIVLLHGFPDTPHSWSEIAGALAADGWRVTVPWLRGYHPETFVAGRPYDPETLGRDVLGLLDALDIESAVLVGHDWGALAGYVATALDPQRVRAIVTCGIPHPSVLRRTPRALWGVRHFLALKLPWAPWLCERDDFAYLEHLYRRWSPNWSGTERELSLRLAKEALATQATLAGAISYYRDLPLGGAPAAERLGAVPGLIVGGEQDSVVERDLFERTAALLPKPSRAVIVPGAGHWPQREDEALFTRELQSFLAQLDG